MIQRRLETKISDALMRSPSVALVSPRQVGKTTIALTISETTPSIYLDLESRLDLEKVRDITAFHEDNRDKLIMLNQVQRLPEVFAPLRGIIDKERSKGNKTKGFHIACEDIKPEKRYAIYSGKNCFSFGDGITAIPLLDLIKEILNKQ